MDTSILGTWEVKEISYEELLKSYIGFGVDLFPILINELPQVFLNLKFYQSIDSSINVFAIYKNTSDLFAIQLDPIGEVICLWNEKDHIEIGWWVENKYERVIEYIKSTLIRY